MFLLNITLLRTVCFFSFIVVSKFHFFWSRWSPPWSICKMWPFRDLIGGLILILFTLHRFTIFLFTLFVLCDHSLVVKWNISCQKFSSAIFPNYCHRICWSVHNQFNSTSLTLSFFFSDFDKYINENKTENSSQITVIIVARHSQGNIFLCKLQNNKFWYLPCHIVVRSKRCVLHRKNKNSQK